MIRFAIITAGLIVATATFAADPSFIDIPPSFIYSWKPPDGMIQMIQAKRECTIVIGKQLGENGKGVWFSAENPGHGLWVDGGGEMATRLPTVVASGECLNVRLFLTPNDIARPRLEAVKP